MTRMTKKIDNKEDFMDTFQIFDRDGSGIISESEFRNIIKNSCEELTDEEIDDIINEV